MVTGRVVAVGRLQFELGDHLANGTPAWGVHVPETGPLDPVACDRSFARAPEVLRGLAPGSLPTGGSAAPGCSIRGCRPRSVPMPTSCASPGASVSSRRGARRDRGDASVAKFVFGVPLATARSAAPSGRLRAAVLDRWASGGHWTERTGSAPVA